MGVKTLRTQDTLDPRHFGTSAELSRHIGTSVEVSYEHFSTRKTIRHRAMLDQAMARRTAVLA